MTRTILWASALVALVATGGCGAPSSEPRGPHVEPPPPAPAQSASAGAALPKPAPGTVVEPVLVRLIALDTNEKAPTRLPDARAFQPGVRAVLGDVARCRARTSSRAHWVEVEWRVDDAGKVDRVVAHPLFVMPEGKPPAIEDVTLRCIEESARNPPFSAAKGRAKARVFALVGFGLVEAHQAAPLAPGEEFYPSVDGHCRLSYECPEAKRCDEPPSVRCPRVEP